jgi:hypothetical protein
LLWGWGWDFGCADDEEKGARGRLDCVVVVPVSIEVEGRQEARAGVRRPSENVGRRLR